jgi:hypothetical protein
MRPAAPWILAVTLIFAVPAFAFADELTPEKRADIRQLIGVTGAKLPAQLADSMAQSTSRLVRDARPETSERFHVVLRRELTAVLGERMEAPGGLVERLTGVYDKQFTHPEVKQLLAFYQTPLGRKSIEVLPVVMNESASWAQSLVPEIRKRLQAALKKEGLELPRTKK